MNLEQTIETTLKDGGFAGQWTEMEDKLLVDYIIGRIAKFATMKKEAIEARFLEFAHIYSASKIEYEKSTLAKVEAAQKIKQLIESNKAIALTSNSLFVREMAKKF